MKLEIENLVLIKILFRTQQHSFIMYIATDAFTEKQAKNCFDLDVRMVL